MPQMCGWSSAATARASRSKRARRSGSPATFTRQDLDRDGAIEPRVAGFVDLAHAASAKRAEDFVWAESGAGGKGHATLLGWTL